MLLQNLSPRYLPPRISQSESSSAALPTHECWGWFLYKGICSETNLPVSAWKALRSTVMVSSCWPCPSSTALDAPSSTSACANDAAPEISRFWASRALCTKVGGKFQSNFSALGLRSRCLFIPEFQEAANSESGTHVADRALRQVLRQGAVQADKLF